MTKDSKVVAKPTNQKETASTIKQKEKPKEYRYVQGEERTTSEVSSYGRGRMGTVSE